jgi:hypothetical protein
MEKGSLIPRPGGPTPIPFLKPQGGPVHIGDRKRNGSRIDKSGGISTRGISRGRDPGDGSFCKPNHPGDIFKPTQGRGGDII